MPCRWLTPVPLLAVLLLGLLLPPGPVHAQLPPPVPTATPDEPVADEPPEVVQLQPPDRGTVEQLVTGAAETIWRSLLTALVMSLREHARDLVAEDIITRTPAHWTYAHPAVRGLHAWLAGLLTTAAAVLLLAGAVNLPLRRRLAANPTSATELLTRLG